MRQPPSPLQAFVPLQAWRSGVADGTTSGSFETLAVFALALGGVADGASTGAADGASTGAADGGDGAALGGASAEGRDSVGGAALGSAFLSQPDSAESRPEMAATTSGLRVFIRAPCSDRFAASRYFGPRLGSGARMR